MLEFYLKLDHNNRPVRSAGSVVAINTDLSGSSMHYQAIAPQYTRSMDGTPAYWRVTRTMIDRKELESLDPQVMAYTPIAPGEALALNAAVYTAGKLLFGGWQYQAQRDDRQEAA